MRTRYITRASVFCGPAWTWERKAESDGMLFFEYSNTNRECLEYRSNHEHGGERRWVPDSYRGLTIDRSEMNADISLEGPLTKRHVFLVKFTSYSGCGTYQQLAQLLAERQDQQNSFLP